MPSMQMGTPVTLLSKEKVCVGYGYLSSFKAGQVLHTCMLHEDEVAMYVTNVFDSTCKVEEPFQECLGECANIVIRWKYENVVYRVEDATNDVHRHNTVCSNCFQTFEWTEEGGAGDTEENYYSENKKQKRAVEYCPTHMAKEGGTQINSMGSPSTQFQSGLQYEVHGMEEPPTVRKKRSYTRITRRQSKKPLVRKIGEDRLDKVLLQSVRAWMTRSICVAQCLKNIDEREIMDVRYSIWDNSETHDERVTWILGQMRTFVKPDVSTGWKDFIFYVGGTSVCTACYVHVLGYSRRKLERWKEDIRTRDRRSACHGNAMKPHEVDHVAIARAVLKKYINGCGCLQPYRQHFRKRDGTFLPLVLLPMNTKKKNIRSLINESLCESGEKEISVSAFHAMWWKHFLHVQIPRTSRFSKYSVCWEFTSTLEKVVSNTMKDRLKQIYQRHHELQCQEWDAYEDVKLEARNRPDKVLSIVVDEMDQNTTMVPKMCQTVKNIEGRYVKIHLCGILVHGWGLCYNLWIDAHHRHDSNQVVTSTLHYTTLVVQ
jgi:hypothetical protein